MTFSAKVAAFAGSGTPSGTVTFNNGSTVLGTGTLDSADMAIFTTSTLTAGTYSITAAYSGDSHFNVSMSSPLAFAVVDFTFTPATANINVAPGQSGQSTLTITPEGGFNQTVSFSCSGLPSESTCNFSPTSVTPSGAALTTTLTIQTTAPSAQLDHRHAGRGGEVFYALLIPGFMGLVVLAGNRKRTLRSVRFLGLVAALAFSTPWMACGGGSSTPRNPGTPAGNSTVTVTARGSGTTPITHQMTITLSVQ